MRAVGRPRNFVEEKGAARREERNENESEKRGIVTFARRPSSLSVVVDVGGGCWASSSGDALLRVSRCTVRDREGARLRN